MTKQFLGSGVYGRVYREICGGNSPCAAKYIKERRSFDTEVKVLKYLKDMGENGGLVEMIDYDRHKKKINLTLIRESISLEDYLELQVMEHDDLEMFWKNIICVVLNFVKIGVLHGDFKSKNILVSCTQNRLYVHDFGLSKFKKMHDLAYYKNELKIIFLQLFLDFDKTSRMIVEGIKEGWLDKYDCSPSHPKSFNTVLNLLKAVNQKNFKKLIKSEYGLKAFDVVFNSKKVEDYKTLL